VLFALPVELHPHFFSIIIVIHYALSVKQKELPTQLKHQNIYPGINKLYLYKVTIK
jgi:hypothetical protein